MPSLTHQWEKAGAGATGGATSVIVPASPGISHVLTAVNISVTSNAAVNVRGAVAITSGGVSLFTLPIVWSLYETAAVNASDQGAWEGEFPAPIGQDITVTIAAVANVLSYVDLQGYDI